MLFRRGFVVSVMLVCCLFANGKDKKKALLPVDILQAQTVLVTVDPDAGVDLQDPNANRIACENVETALVKGMAEAVARGSTADLIIVIRKGNGKAAKPTIGGTPVNQTPPVIGQSTGSTTQIGGRVENAPPCDAADPRCGASESQSPLNDGPSPSGAHPQMDVGSTQDTFAVYRGGPDPLGAPSVWRYTARMRLMLQMYERSRHSESW